MTKYRKKSVVIDATQWFKNGDHPNDYDPIGEGPFSQRNLEKYAKYIQTEGKIVRYYRNPKHSGNEQCQECGDVFHNHGWIDTLEGGHIVCPGDFIITGIQGEIYPCKPDIFDFTYELEEKKDD